jgi:hypothetical protein
MAFTVWRWVTIPPPQACEVYEVTKSEPSAWGNTWATLFLEDINMGTWPSKCGRKMVTSSAELGPKSVCESYK